MEDDSVYEQKYLKYKNKYLELKKIEEQLGGVALFSDGIYCFFTSSDLATSIDNEFKRSPPKLDKIKEILHNEAYMIEDGSKELRLVLKPKNLIKKDEPVVGNKQEKLPLTLELFNRCNTNDISNVKTILNAYNFKPTKMIVVKIYKTKKNKLMSITNL